MRFNDVKRPSSPRLRATGSLSGLGLATRICALTLAATPAASARETSWRTPCNPGGTRPVLGHGERHSLVAVRGRARVFTVWPPGAFREEVEVYGCFGDTRQRPVDLDRLSGKSVFAAPRKGYFGMYGLQLRGRHAVWGSVGDDRDGDRGVFLGPDVKLANLRTHQVRDIPGAVDFELTPRGTLFYVFNVHIRDSFNGELGDGSRPGPGPFEVHRVRGRTNTLLDWGDGISPRSLASNGEDVYWLHDGQPRFADASGSH